MTKEQAIDFLKEGHEYFKKVIDNLDKSQLSQDHVLGDWGIKDIVAHLAAWNLEQAKAVDLILSNHKPRWWGLDSGEFNKMEVDKRKNLTPGEVISEWKESFTEFISQLEKISDDDFIHDGCPQDDDSPISIEMMLSYRYNNLDHEGGHAKQLEEFFKTK